jgi:hypothetical protein
MSRGILILIPRGNSRAIQTLPEELQEELSCLYVEMCEIFEALLEPWLWGLLGPLLVALAFRTLSEYLPGLTWVEGLWLALLSYILSVVVAKLLYYPHVREARERLRTHLARSQDPEKMLEILKTIDSLRFSNPT